MANFFPPTFEEMHFVCKDCGHWFQGRDCKKGVLEMLLGSSSPLPPPFGPKCPECGSRNTEQNPGVVY